MQDTTLPRAAADAAPRQTRARHYGAKTVGGTVVTAIALSGALASTAQASAVDPTSDSRTDIATTPGLIPALGPLPLLGPALPAGVLPFSTPLPLIALRPDKATIVAGVAPAQVAAAPVPAAKKITRPVLGPRPILGPVPAAVVAPALVFPPAELMAKWAAVAYESKAEAAIANRLAPSYESKSDSAAARRLAVTYRRESAPAASTKGLSAKQKARAKALSDMRVSAHRGGTGWGPESTLATFRKAMELGADSIEFDVQFTRDNVPIVIHDYSLNRTTDCKGLVALVTLKKLRACDAGTWYKPNPLKGEEVPTLEEALATIAGSGTRVYLHVKTANLQQARSIVRLLDEFDMNLTSGEDNPATVIGDTHLILAQLRAAGAKRLGLVFHNLKGWYTGYEVVVPFAEAVSPAMVARAQQRGQYVTMVQSKNLTVNNLADLGVDEYMVNNLEETLIGLGRLDSSELLTPVAGNPGPERAGTDGADGADGSDAG